jgi:hypothetical protein
MDGQSAVAGLGHRDERLERQMQALLGLEGMLDDARRARHGRVNVAAPQVIVERDIGVGAALEVFQIGKRAGGFERVVDDDVRRHRRDFVVDRRQFVVFDLDQLRGAFGDVRIVRQHGRDRLADMVHLVERQDRLVMKRRTVIGLRDQLADILAGDDAMHAGDGFRGARVDSADAAMRHR